MTSSPSIRVLIVDDHEVVRAGIAALLSGLDDITVVATAGSGVEALELCDHHEIDVILMDLSMPDIDGVTTTERLLERHPQARVVVLTAFVDDVAVPAVVRAGAKACLLKTVGMIELAEAIRGVMQGRSTFSSEFLSSLAGSPPRGRHLPHLTRREHEILELVAAGQTNKRIARTLHLTEGTVRIYVSGILSKLGAANRTEATVVAIREGLVNQEADCHSG
jgi:NarL family two-component system response regulator LiaR